MSEAETLFAALRQSTGDDEVAMLERMVRDAPDHALNKINALDLAAKEGIGEERVIAALLNAVGLGIFEMSWNVICPSCAGVVSANKSLKTVDRAQYNCAFCAAGYETTLVRGSGGDRAAIAGEAGRGTRTGARRLSRLRRILAAHACRSRKRQARTNSTTWLR
jgi:hypothetical protein